MTQRLPKEWEIESLLAQYDWQGAAWKQIHIGGNYVVKVQLPAGGLFVLRLSPSSTSAAKVMQELDWLNRLRSAGFNQLQRPVLNINKAPITVSEDGFGAFGNVCVAFEWIDGNTLFEDASRNAVIEAGSSLARLHQVSEKVSMHLSEAYENNSDHKLDNDCEWIETLQPFWTSSKKLILNNQEKQLIGRAAACARDHIRRVGRDLSSYGPIHGDMNARNIIVDKSNAVSIIDFEETRFGFYSTDVASLALHLSRCKNGHELGELFISSYAKNRGPTTFELKELSTFKILNLIMFLKWLNEGCHESKLGEGLAVVPWALASIREASEEFGNE